MSKKILALVGIVTVALLVGGVVWYGKRGEEMPPLKDDSKVAIEDKKEEEKNENIQPEYDFSEDLDVSAWATYESEKVGVRIKYPKRWEIVNFEDPKADVVLRSPKADGQFYSIGIGSISNTRNLSIKKLFDTFDDTSRLWFTRNSYEDVTFRIGSGIYFPEVIEGSYRNESYFISGKGIVYSFQYDYNEGQENQFISQILRKIVENFEPLK